ncbi:hypothetical protein FAZ69_09235 [Trinickia terrae]|uniref:Uncharacterized protein n=1 Tax=Trinickia terrae TaxID=2571161 RepID=A0A4U1IA06_9BURK|nr:hypothetical protein [Trinickia terrae]TKC90312.1 hypothetical protein FAZ69_09235 [Trinickia terrae]
MTHPTSKRFDRAFRLSKERILYNSTDCCVGRIHNPHKAGKMRLLTTAIGLSFFLVLGLAPFRSANAQGSESGSDGIAAIKNAAAKSSCAAIYWKNHRGFAPKSYIEGMALVFARSLCHPDRPDVAVVSQAVDTTKAKTDALAAYDQKFKQLHLNNDSTGLDTFRHSYVLLLGLGMMESSGNYCEGRDVSQCFNDADSAEAGLFQTSYGVRRVSHVLNELFQHYSQDQHGCMLDEFKGNLSCKIVKSHNPKCPDATSDVVGSGAGADWQRLTKSCPAFAAEYAAVVLRTSGGLKGEFNPVRKMQADVRPECDEMFKDVQTYVQRNPQVCAALN